MQPPASIGAFSPFWWRIHSFLKHSLSTHPGPGTAEGSVLTGLSGKAPGSQEPTFWRERQKQRGIQVSEDMN